MPSAIPDRFKLEMRLGRDGDIEEWLGNDTSLDRPVLIRTLGPETSPERRREFVRQIGEIAGVSHQHLAKVYMVAEVPGGAYAVVEWAGGSSLADHIGADTTIDLAEFLPNATGLAGALAALHERGSVHGDIDLSAITYATAHPAKLGAFGRIARTDALGDTADLARVLETALTGFPPGGPPPSERIDGVTPTIDTILRSAQNGNLDSASMEKALSAAPTPRVPGPGPKAGSRRLIYSAIALVVLAIAMVAIGLVLSGASTEPVLPTRPTTATTMTSTTTTTTPATQTRVLGGLVFDPLAGTPVDDPTVEFVHDGDLTTTWESERFETQPTEGFGLILSVSGQPEQVELVDMTGGTGFEIRWAPTPIPDPTEWETLARARSSPGSTVIFLPTRADGHWLIWFTELPIDVDGTLGTAIAEVRFLP